MKILLDNCVDWRLARDLPDHEVIHARTLGWESHSNGTLLAAAEREQFDLVVTVDKNFRFQQATSHRKLSLITLSPVLTKLSTLKPLVPKLIQVIEDLIPGSSITIESDR